MLEFSTICFTPAGAGLRLLRYASGGGYDPAVSDCQEAYRNDVLAANRMYPEICRIADRPDMEQCVVVFTGGMDSGLQGPAVLGELAGRSFFDAEAHTAGGVSARAGCLFQILGMDLQVQPENLEQYHQAIQFMKDAPDWPAQGSIRKMGDVVVVRLSESWI